MNRHRNARFWRAMYAVLAVFVATVGFAADAASQKIRVAGIYTVPVEQKWVATLHRALGAAEAAGEIEYTFVDRVSAADYVRVLRERAASGVDLIIGEAFGIGREARRVADDNPNVAFLMGDSDLPHGTNFAVFDNWIHEPCYLMGVIAGAMTRSGKIGMVGGRPIGEVNRLFHAFMAGARSVDPQVQFKVAFIDSWYDPPKAEAEAQAQIAAGVDVLFAEREGVVDAARDAGVIAFGNVNDMNRTENGAGIVVASALWNMEPSINRAIDLVRHGRFEADDYREWSMMAKGGASLSPYHEFESRVPAAAKAKVEELTRRIKEGSFTVPINDSRPLSTF